MSMKNWSTTAGSNATVDSINFAEGQAPSTVNDSARALMADVRYELATQDTIASATTTDLGSKDAGSLTVSGTTTITGFGTVSAGIRRLLTFSGVLTLTHNGTSLILPGAANITTAAGDSCVAESLGSGNWKVHSYQRASGAPVPSTLSVNINGTVGATTPNTVAGTTGAFSGLVSSTLSNAIGFKQTFTNGEAGGFQLTDGTRDLRLQVAADGTCFVGTVSNHSLAFLTNGGVVAAIDGSGHVSTGTDNAQTLGTASKRWSVVHAGTGTINTSDAREKTAVSAMTSAEIEASKQLAREIGIYKWLSSVAEKGEAARKHVGFTVQRAIEIMQANGLDPMAYGFICYDQWDVGDRYAFRFDELSLFIARGFEARLSALEAV